MKKHVLITGTNGFIGKALCDRMVSEDYQVRGTVRSLRLKAKIPASVNVSKIKSIGPDTDWSRALAEINYVVHLAGQVHATGNICNDSIALFRRVNVEGTKRLAQEAALANVRRFIFMSSVKVNGEGRSTPYNEDDIQTPQDAYSVSKWEAEKVLNKISDETSMETVIIRSPLVYGPCVKANFLRLLNLVDRGIPLPLASIKNRRSLIYLENLVDAIVTCIKNPRASGQTYFVSDGEDVSTPELIRRMGSVLGKPVRLFPFPPFMLKIAGCISGKLIGIDRLLGSLMVDSSKIRRDLDWKAPFSMNQGLKETAKWYMSKNLQ